jgi:hypothetical protein
MRNKAKKLNTCRTQLNTLESGNTAQQTQLTAVNLSLSKLVIELPIQTESIQIQKQIDAIQAEILQKTAACMKLRKQKKRARANACDQQLVTLRDTESTQKAALINANNEAQKTVATSTPKSTSRQQIINFPTAPDTTTAISTSPESSSTPTGADCNLAPSDGSQPTCTMEVGCMDTGAINYSSTANIPSTECIYESCTDGSQNGDEEGVDCG